MHDVCGGLVCMMCVHQMCVVRLKLLCVCKHRMIILFLRRRSVFTCMLCEGVCRLVAFIYLSKCLQ